MAFANVLDDLNSQQDRGLARAIVTTALRRKGQIDEVLQHFLAKPLPSKSGNASTILEVAVVQLLFMRIPAHAAIDLAVRLACSDRNARHFSGLVNAVLRKIAMAGDDLLQSQNAARLNTPDWLMQRWCETYGDDVALRIGDAHLVEPPLDLSVKIQSDAERWAAVLAGSLLPNGTIRLQERSGRIEDLPGYDEGAWWIQDAAAALPTHLLGNVAGKHVLDLCAAPGGKTAQLAAGGARVTAVDISPQRLERLSQNLARLDLAAELICEDAARFVAQTPYDAVLADVPCSATGTIRRHPDLALLKTRDQAMALQETQADILRNAVSAVRKGGQIVYATCSLEPEEGAQQIESLLAGSLPVSRYAVTGKDVFGLDHLISEQGDLRSLPCHHIGNSEGMDGFYASRLVKN